jgi:putative DNA primase/helicase
VRNEAAVEALEMWSRAGPASADHAYVAKKRLDPAPLRELDGKLLIPMVDASGKLWNLQRIAGDGTKRFLRGGRTEGLFCLIGYDITDASAFCIGEGYSTMAAVHRASGHPCIVTFSARTWRRSRALERGAAGPRFHHLRRRRQLVIIRHRMSVAEVAREAVAEEIGAKVAMPPPGETSTDERAVFGAEAA